MAKNCKIGTECHLRAISPPHKAASDTSLYHFDIYANIFFLSYKLFTVSFYLIQFSI